MEILNVIHAVLDYREYIIYDNRVTKKFDPSVFDTDKEAFKYYCSLPLPEGMKANYSDFNRILAYKNWDKLGVLDRTEEKVLCNYEWKVA
jgi:hypothetical protein